MWRTSNSFSVEGGGEVTLSMNENEDFTTRKLELKVEPYGEYSGGSITLSMLEFEKLEKLVSAMRRLIEHRDGGT